MFRVFEVHVCICEGKIYPTPHVIEIITKIFLLFFMFKQFLKLHFFISWWAYTFPLAAITIATILVNSVYHKWFIKAFAVFLLALTTIVVGFVSYKTYFAIKNKQICIPEEE